MIENQIPSFDIIRKNFESRYYVVDSQMTGFFRFSYGISNDEAILKDGTSVKCSEYVQYGSREIKVDNKPIGIKKNAYIKIGSLFYLVESYTNNTIFIYDTFKTDINVGEEVRLYSVNVYIDNTGVCTKFDFHQDDTITFGNFIYHVTEKDTVDTIYEMLSKLTLVTKFGNTLYVLGDLKSYYDYEQYDKYPVNSHFLNVSSLNYIVPGDSLVLFNEDIRANNTVYVEKTKELMCASGFKYTLKLKGLSGTFKYGQLRAFPAYLSQKLNIHKCKPSIIDVCGDTVYGKDVKIVSGVKLHSVTHELTNGYEDIKYVAAFDLEPSDLWLNEVITGRVIPELPKLKFITDEDGFFKMFIDSKIPQEFLFRFSSPYSDTKISFCDLEMNPVVQGTVNEDINCDLNSKVLSIKSLPNTEIVFDTFKCVSEHVHSIEYYFVCQETSNERIEVNCLHLNPVFKNYRELLAVIGRDKAGEGRIAL